MANSNQQPELRLGFVGMGAMGSRMANWLLAAYYGRTGYNRTHERTHPLQQRGAKVAATPKEVAAEVDVVLSCVANDAALADVRLGPDGALKAARPGTIFIEMSPVSPRTSNRVYETAIATGVSVLDAPVSGSTLQAEQGKLVIFVGGKEEVYNKCKPIREVLGTKSCYMGPSGTGATMKLGRRISHRSSERCDRWLGRATYQPFEG